MNLAVLSTLRPKILALRRRTSSAFLKPPAAQPQALYSLFKEMKRQRKETAASRALLSLQAIQQTWPLFFMTEVPNCWAPRRWVYFFYASWGPDVHVHGFSA